MSAPSLQLSRLFFNCCIWRSSGKEPLDSGSEGGEICGLTFPNGENLPSGFTECAEITGIALRVALALRLPECGV